MSRWWIYSNEICDHKIWRISLFFSTFLRKLNSRILFWMTAYHPFDIKVSQLNIWKNIPKNWDEWRRSKRGIFHDMIHVMNFMAQKHFHLNEMFSYFFTKFLRVFSLISSWVCLHLFISSKAQNLSKLFRNLKRWENSIIVILITLVRQFIILLFYPQKIRDWWNFTQGYWSLKILNPIASVGIEILKLYGRV
jgi:hypothetical protein